MTDNTVNEIKKLLTTNAIPTQTSSTTTFPLPYIGRIPSNNTAYDLPKPKQEDYPEIKYWHKRDYVQIENAKKRTAAVLDPTIPKQRAPRGSTRLAQSDENVATDYIETENGDIVSGTTAQSIRSTIRNLLKEIKETKGMLLPEVWKDIGQNEHKFIFNGLYSNFPYIRLCDDDWKACFLASRVLANMKHTEKRRQMRTSVKIEPDLADSEDEGVNLGIVAEVGPSLPPAGLKRQPSASFELDKPKPTKRGRTDSVLSILPSDPPELTSFEIHNTSSLPIPQPVISAQVDIGLMASNPLPAKTKMISQGVNISGIKLQPKLVRRVPLCDRSIQESDPQLQCIDLEPSPHNLNLVQRVKRTSTSESTSAVQLTPSTHEAPAAAIADTDPSNSIAIINPLFVYFYHQCPYSNDFRSVESLGPATGPSNRLQSLQFPIAGKPEISKENLPHTSYSLLV